MENRETTLALFQASPPLHDNFGNVYIFRIIETDRAHAPQTLDEIETKVRNDWRTNEALKKARDAAKLLVEQSKTRGGIQQALNANNSQAKVITTGSFTEGDQVIENYKLPSEAATAKLSRDAFSLLGEKLRTGNDHPAGVFELPQAGLVIAAQLEKAKATPKMPFLDVFVANQQLFMERQRQAQILFQWMQPKNVEERVHYVPTNREEKKAPYDPLGVPPPNPLSGV